MPRVREHTRKSTRAAGGFADRAAFPRGPRMVTGVAHPSGVMPLVSSNDVVLVSSEASSRAFRSNPEEE
jgi:hypothetical protein